MLPEAECQAKKAKVRGGTQGLSPHWGVWGPGVSNVKHGATGQGPGPGADSAQGGRHCPTLAVPGFQIPGLQHPPRSPPSGPGGGGWAGTNPLLLKELLDWGTRQHMGRLGPARCHQACDGDGWGVGRGKGKLLGRRSWS